MSEMQKHILNSHMIQRLSQDLERRRAEFLTQFQEVAGEDDLIPDEHCESLDCNINRVVDDRPNWQNLPGLQEY